jgi:hypothetical protein
MIDVKCRGGQSFAQDLMGIDVGAVGDYHFDSAIGPDIKDVPPLDRMCA